MSEIELDEWFFNLPFCLQEEITGIKFMRDYELFDDSVAEWWDNHDYDEKLDIYESEELLK